MRPHLLILLLAPTSVGLHAQDGPLARITAAEKMFAEKRIDDGLTALAEIAPSIDSIESESVRKVTGDLIEDLLAKHDPMHTAKASTHRAIAEQCNKLAQGYLRKKWYATALDVLELGARFDPDVVAKRLAYAKRKHDSVAAKSKSDAIDEASAKAKEVADRDILRSIEVLYHGPGDWTREGEELVSCPVKERTQLLIGRAPRHADHWLRCDVKLEGSNDDSAAMIFGALSAHDYFIAEIHAWVDVGQLAMRLHYYDGQTAHKLTERIVHMPEAALRGWHTLDVRVRHNRIEFSLANRWKIEANGSRPAHGALGLFITGGRETEQLPARFRRMFIDELDEAPPLGTKTTGGEPEKASPADDLVAIVTQCESEIADGRAEPAVARLRSLGTELDTLGDTTRERIESMIDDLTGKADPVAAARDKAFAEIAASLAEFGLGYAKARLPRTALRTFDRAGTFDRVIAAKARADAEPLIGDLLAKMRGLPAEPDVPTDNKALVAEFEHGRTDWSPGPWQFFDHAVISPPPGASGAVLVGKTAHKTFGKAKVQVSGTSTAARGLIFGFRSRFDFWAAIFSPRNGGRVILAHYYGDSWQTLLAQNRRYSPEAQQQWMTIEVEFTADLVRAKFGTGTVLEAKPKQPIRPGACALWVSTGDHALLFRNYAFETKKD